MRKPLQVLADTIPWLIAGWFAAIGTQASGWWLNSGHGVLVTTTTFAVVAFLVLFFSHRAHRVRLVFLWIGAQAGLARMLFHADELSLFPIVLVIGGMLSAVSMGLGGSLGWISGRFVQNRAAKA
jgi:hypothetical protein